ncbi:hypothetical protein SDC9_192375 [bioreactor metagenome]|uniref:Uncharacterized protein n=1 Tax=bioreactor metagenome TaxID=1076179 RepID=A0A645I0N0_9ZZZZ
MLRIDHGIDHLLRPFGAILEIALVHGDDAARVLAPDVAGETQYAADTIGFCGGIERLGDDEAGNRTVGQGRSHVGRGHDGESDFVRLQAVRRLGDHA